LTIEEIYFGDEIIPHKRDWFDYCNLFRKGTYEDSSDALKESWLVFCEYFMKDIVKEWKSKSVRCNSYISDKCTISDEAFAVTIAQSSLKKWIGVLHAESMNPTKKRRKTSYGDGDTNNEEVVVEAKEGSDKDDDDVEEDDDKEFDKNVKRSSYYDNFLRLQALKDEHEEDWKSWDLAFKEFISVSLEESLEFGVSDDKNPSSRIASQSSNIERPEYEKLSLENW
jgi:hypothetical protein